MKVTILLFLTILLSMPIFAELDVDIPFDPNVMGPAWDSTNYTFTSEHFYVTNLGETDIFTITVSSDNLPENWNLMWCHDGLCSPTLVQELELTQNQEMDLDFILSPVASASECDIQFLFEAPSLDEAVAITFHFQTEDAVSSPDNTIPEVKPTLLQNYPNPFNPVTTIDYYLEESDHVELSVFNMKGQTLITLYDGFQSRGNHSVIWDGKDQDGNPVSSGMYFYKLRSSRYYTLKKMILMK